MIAIVARRDCRYCHGSGTVYDTVDYGSTTAQMPSDCEDCISAGWPEGADDDAEYEIVPAPSVWGDSFGSSQGDMLVTDAERAEEKAYWKQREAELADRYRIEPYDPARDLTLRDVMTALTCTEDAARRYLAAEVKAHRLSVRKLPMDGAHVNVYRKTA